MRTDDEFEALDLHKLDAVWGAQHPGLWAAMDKAYSLGLNVHWLHTGPHYPNSRHWRGRAIDLGGSPAQLQKFFNWAKGTNYHEVIYKNTFMRDGRRVRPIGGHNDHVHYSV
jgi:hypothetical protein